MGMIRKAAVAGQFYPGTESELTPLITSLMAKAGTVGADHDAPKAIVAPHAGYIYSGATAAKVYARLKPSTEIIKRIVLIGPCHRVAVRGFAVSSADGFETPLGTMPVDIELRQSALKLEGVHTFDATHEKEHSLEVHLPFLQTLFPSATVLPMVVGDATPEVVARVLSTLWGGPETLIVVSSDLSHYLGYDEASALDRKTCNAIEALDIDAIGQDQACGRIPLKGLMALAKQRGMTVETVDLCNSGDTAGPKDRVVGYGAWAFYEAGNNPTKTDFEAETKTLLKRYGGAMLDVAAASIRNGLKVGRSVQPNLQTFPTDLQKTGACFVTLKKAGQLRGCIGSPQAYRPLAQDVAENAFSAAFKDPRFKTLTAAETGDLVLSISVLSPATAMTFTDEADLLSQLRPGIDGLIIEDGNRRALFLPSVWEQLPDAATFVDHLKRKAGMAPNHWSETFAAKRFIAEEISSKSLADSARLWRDAV